MFYDYLVVGHGLAGAILTWTLRQYGYKVLVIDAEKTNSASNVAAGLINPVAGKRFAKSWQADIFLPAAAEFYKELEQEFNTKFFHPKPILKLFSSIEEQNTWMGKSAGQQNEYIEKVFPELPASEEVYQETGGLQISGGGFVEIKKLVNLLRKQLLQQNKLLSEAFDITKLQVNEKDVRYGEIQAGRVIFCEGFQAVHNSYFSWLPFSLNKGEVLDVEINNFSAECIYNKGVYVVPYGNERWKIGATYNWREPNEETTATGLEELLSKTKQLLKLPVKLTGHVAGIRPAVRDRKPLIGLHPEHPVLGIFNGMGSKGVSMAPYLARQFTEALAGNGSLWPEVSVSRYQTLYYEREKLL